MNYKVYMHTNKQDGKKYIGITLTEPKRRWGRNGIKYKGSVSFYGAILKYGWEGFEHEILFSNLTIEQAQQKEIELIKKYNTQHGGGYNILAGGNLGTVGKITTEETRKKQSISHFKMTDETRQKMGIAQTGRKHTPETIAKMKKNNRHISPTEEHKKHLSEINSGTNSVWYGRKHTPQELQKMRDGAKNRTPEYKKHLSDALTGRKLSKEHARKNGIAHSKALLQYDLNGVFLKEWSSQSAASKATNIPQGSISNCCVGKIKTCKGFIWKTKA